MSPLPPCRSPAERRRQALPPRILRTRTRRSPMPNGSFPMAAPPCGVTPQRQRYDRLPSEGRGNLPRDARPQAAHGTERSGRRATATVRSEERGPRKRTPPPRGGHRPRQSARCPTTTSGTRVAVRPSNAGSSTRSGRPAAARSLPAQGRARTEQVPTVAGDVEEDGETSVGLIVGSRYELDVVVQHPCIAEVF